MGLISNFENFSHSEIEFATLIELSRDSSGPYATSGTSKWVARFIGGTEEEIREIVEKLIWTPRELPIVRKITRIEQVVEGPEGWNEFDVYFDSTVYYN